MNRTARYFVCVVLIFLVLVVNFFYLARISLRDNQAKDLSLQANKIFELIKDGDFTKAYLNEADIDFVIYVPKSRRIIVTNNEAIPLFPLARGIQHSLIKNPDDNEKRISILYLTRAFALSNEKMVNIQVSMPAEKKLSEKIINFMPLSALNVLLPLLVILFLLISLYFFRLEKKYNSQKEFIANMSHELKTPIAVISGHADLLRRHWKKLLEKNESEFENSVSLISKESENMTKIVQNLLELTRLENRLTKLQKEKIAVKDFFEEIKEEWTSRGESRAENSLFERSVHIEIEPCDENLVIFTDKNLLKQIFCIAIENSKKHAEAENLKITLHAEKSGRKSSLSIRDNGKGFSKEALSRGFERFYSGDKSHKKGSGIGLSLAKSIARVLGAKIRLENDGGAVLRAIVSSK